ncbi:MAG: hypothetical protein OXF74_00525 [Rhodobacteraceae bacterium]|nr:hypothetical protein [Paracoccaceae bacterium]
MQFITAVLAAGGVVDGHADAIGDWTIEQWGTISLEGRVFLNSPKREGQHSSDFSATAKPTVYIEFPQGSFTFTPYFRIDNADEKRRLIDIQEAYFLQFGSIGDSAWELRLGIDQVFWGVAESNNPVNIINQTDLAGHPGGEQKLGQPMIHGTLNGDWGILDLFVLPYHRVRTFPGEAGRLGVPVRSDSGGITYETSRGKRNIDLAARYGHTVGPLDFGISYFKGTSREPALLPDFPLKQQYNLIRQTGLELQFVQDAFLGKAELIRRRGFSGDGTSHSAFVVGGEYSFYSVLETSADLTLYAEWNQDDRREKATTPLQNDMFYAARYALNDVDDTTFSAALIDDLDYSTQTLLLEFDKRLSDSAQLNLELFKFLDTDPVDPQTGPISQDDYVAINLSYSF